MTFERNNLYAFVGITALAIIIWSFNIINIAMIGR